jgi:hypothetical protein
MSALANQPTNLNYLSPLGFRFSVNRIAIFTHFVQTINIPDLVFGNIGLVTPFVKLPVPGDQIQFGELSASFKVDEDMQAYTDIYDWMIALGYPDNFNQYRAVAPINAPAADSTSKGNYSDATLTILSSAYNPIVEVVFYDIFPISLGGMTFDSRMSTVDHLEASVSFAYKRFEVKRL